MGICDISASTHTQSKSVHIILISDGVVFGGVHWGVFHWIELRIVSNIRHGDPTIPLLSLSGEAATCLINPLVMFLTNHGDFVDDEELQLHEIFCQFLRHSIGGGGGGAHCNTIFGGFSSFSPPQPRERAAWYVVPPIKIEATPEEAQIKSLEDIFQREAKCFNAPIT